MTSDEELRSEIASLAGQLKVREFRARIALWRKGGISGGMSSDLVKSSREAKLPQLDRMDRKLEEAERDYLEAIREAYGATVDGHYRIARRRLQMAIGLQEVWLVPIEVPDKERREQLESLTSDAKSCACSNTKELWERERHRTPWRIKAGFGPCCYSSWAAAGRPEKLAWLKLNRPLEEASA